MTSSSLNMRTKKFLLLSNVISHILLIFSFHRPTLPSLSVFLSCSSSCASRFTFKDHYQHHQALVLRSSLRFLSLSLLTSLTLNFPTLCQLCIHFFNALYASAHTLLSRMPHPTFFTKLLFIPHARAELQDILERYNSPTPSGNELCCPPLQA